MSCSSVSSVNFKTQCGSVSLNETRLSTPTRGLSHRHRLSEANCLTNVPLIAARPGKNSHLSNDDSGTERPRLAADSISSTESPDKAITGSLLFS
jgi:hypothetical protein